jgi:hypothetical protein
VNETRLLYAGSGNLVMAVGHLHIGGVNTTFSINGKPVCTSYPEYGTEVQLSVLSDASLVYSTCTCLKVGVAGHEAGYVTAIKPCYFDQPIPFLKGDNISVYSLYNTRYSFSPRVDPEPLTCTSFAVQTIHARHFRVHMSVWCRFSTWEYICKGSFEN